MSTVETLRGALRRHWPEYLMEAFGLGAFMLAAASFGVLLEHPDSPLRQAIPAALARRALMGLAMGATAVGLIYSPWGRQSGAHYNPSTTLGFWRLGRVKGADALFYVLAQFCGGTLGLLLAAGLWRGALGDAAVHYVATVPGRRGALAAFAAEFGIAFLLMSVVLRASGHARLARWTGCFAGALVALYITFEAPLSGMSLNPARSFSSDVPAGDWSSYWIYATAPPLGMLAAVELHRRKSVGGCAKLVHAGARRCIFCGENS